MASPFRIFRKHQKAMLAVLGLMAMIAFVFLPILMDQMSTRSVQDPVLATTKAYGDVTRNQVGMMIGRRQALLGFLYQIQYAVQQAGAQGTEAMRLSRRIGEATEQSVVDTWLLAQKAEDLGLSVDDETINGVLNSLTEQRLSAEKVQQILHDSRMRQGMLFDTLRTELLAMRLQEMFGVSLAGTTPAQGWEYFQRLNRKATVEVAALPVAGFVNRVADPSEAVLREFFDKYKDNLPDPANPEPGFRTPRKIAIEYVKADFDQMLKTVEPEITDEEVRKYYEEHKENYKREELPAIEPKTAPKPEVDKPAETEPAPAEKTPETAKPAEEPQKQPAAAPGAEAKVPATPPSEKPAESSPAEAKKDQPEETPALNPPANESSSHRVVSPLLLASYQAEGGAKTEDAPAESAKPEPAPGSDKTDEKKPETVAETPAAQPKQPDKAEPAEKSQPPVAPSEPKEAPAEPKAEPAAPQGEMTSEKPAPAEAAEKKPEEKPPAEKQPAGAPAPPAAAAESKPAAEKPAEAEKTKAVSYIPLEEVRDEIRRQLARDRARAKVQEMLQRIQEKLAIYHNEWIVYDATVREEGHTTKTPPARPDLAKLVEGTPLAAHKTQLISAIEAAPLDIGGSWIGNAPFRDFAYANSLLKFKPATSQDNDGNSYLFWKTEESEERAPEFDNPETRKEVLRAWKTQQARKVAKEEAEKLAKDARGSGKSLKEFLAGKQGMTVAEAGPFSWLTYGNIPPMYWLQSRQPPQISEVQGVHIPGPEFMQTVFALQPGEIGVAMNRPEAEVYLVRAVEFNPLPDVLWTLFLEDPLSRYMAAAADQRDLWGNWMEEIRESAGFQWIEKPRPNQRES
ncbi:MAG: hypothetical protein HUU20_08665 [Pirellulales bacterium]|nr:hypothetical protein [Pirellulales bacterium]